MVTENSRVPVSVDLDLDAEDARLREAVGASTSVRVNGNVIHVDHASVWPNRAMRAAVRGDWDEWAEAVIRDEKELDVFRDADLKNYQIEAVFTECGKNAQSDQGKSRPASKPSRNTRRR
jgi:hypothetical protein